jgi:hypothetical protein
MNRAWGSGPTPTYKDEAAQYAAAYKMAQVCCDVALSLGLCQGPAEWGMR